ncbi:mitochondrial carrier [Coccomyxa subellipsoidea C-169]|uniref:Mitochondrial carrier n=1 Tax=Coccomyxa subellipsoidea (strain C-169) TaxID=574566 RepID=I0YRI8_COCSC|nr:mitochondrial carrier [Coccomyxa subellipsoidea C-169]EIE21007.1 mitochondrial carrier [Coccomyxa subellipsoidea C-169]|eukprot:XP_005645551.1 mitochondrial carrier [Coccomyxa subellipsoidea C-169]
MSSNIAMDLSMVPGTPSATWATDLRLRQTFDEIDEGHKGFLEEGDLRQYAQQHGLPTEYIPAFMQSALRGGHTYLSFDRFRQYISGRESSLKRTFDRLDADGDGRLTAEEAVEALLQHALEPTGVRRRQQSGRSMSFSDFRQLFLLLPQTDMLVDYWLRAACPGACDIGGGVVMHDGNASARGSPWGHLMAGAAAGALSRTAVAPLETLRLQAMVGQSKAPNLMAAARGIVASSGVAGLYRGNLVNVLRSAPQKSLDFFAFDMFKGLLRAKGARTPLPVFAAAGMAGAASSALLYPLEVVRSRITCDTLGLYGGTGHTLRRIVREEGFGALYRGIGPSVAAIIPEAAITYGLFDTLKRGYARVGGRGEAGVLPSISFGVVSAFVGQLVAFPLETVSRRMQVGGCSSEALGFLPTLRDIVRKDGALALYKGVGAASLRVIPMAVVSFGTYEAVRLWLTALEEHLRQHRSADGMQESQPVCVSNK